MGFILTGDAHTDDYIPQEYLQKDELFQQRKSKETQQPVKPFIPNREVILNRNPIFVQKQPKPLPWNKRTDLIMLGTGPTHEQCPFDCETWSINDAFQSLRPKRLDKLFFFDRDYMQHPFPLDRDTAIRTTHLKAQGVELNMENINRFGLKYRVITPYILNTELPDTEIVSIWIVPEIKNLTILPMWEMVAKWKTDFFTNSFAWMIAYALWLGKYKKIKFYGVDMTNNHEVFRNERGSVEHWIGVARGMGLDIEISKGSYICKRELYGVE